MKIVVDFDLCESNAVCMQIAPDVFEAVSYTHLTLPTNREV